MVPATSRPTPDLAQWSSLPVPRHRSTKNGRLGPPCLAPPRGPSRSTYTQSTHAAPPSFFAPRLLITRRCCCCFSRAPPLGSPPLDLPLPYLPPLLIPTSPLLPQTWKSRLKTTSLQNLEVVAILGRCSPTCTIPLLLLPIRSRCAVSRRWPSFSRPRQAPRWEIS